jgi:hypothetical protein
MVFACSQRVRTGKMSVEAIKAHHPESGVQEPKLTADHEYPRKIAAADLLTEHASGETDLEANSCRCT